MRRFLTLTALLCAAAAASLVLPAFASASSRQVTIVQDDGRLYRGGPTVRRRALDELKALGADVVKVQVYWDEIAPGGRRKPSGFDGANPASYDWRAYDDFVRAAVERGLRPFLALGGRAPAWAVRRQTARLNGIYRPSALELERFARAAGTRYSGSYGGLPRVTLWSAWNEPNLSSWLRPQRSRRGVVLSPSIYRNLYLAVYRGLRATGHGGDTILLGELMPLGGRSSKRVAPLLFLRELACLNRRYRPYRGRAARARGCKRVGRIPTSGLAYHPYTPRGGPRARTRNRDDASIANLGRLTRVLNALGRRGKLPRRVPVWITEYGFQTNPPDPLQYPIRRVPGFMDESEWLAFRSGRVRSYSQFQLFDDRLNPGGGLRRFAGFQGGLRFSSGRAKPGIYAAFRLPAFVRLLGGGRVEVFGGLRSGAPGSAVTVQSRTRGGSYRLLGGARLNASGYFRKIYSVSGASRRLYRVTIGGLARVKRPARR
jgi:hypothetical protein